MSSAIVVGGGSAGAVVARRLHDAGVVTTLLEAGGEDLNPAIHDPSRAGELWHGPEDWDRHTVPQEHAAGRRLHLPRGKVLGGSHALNAMIWVRCAPSDYDGWEAAGCTGWGWDTVRPVYEAIENDLLPVTDDYPLTPIQESILAAYGQEGVPRNPDYNAGALDGASQEQITARDGRRVNTWMAYLKPVRDAVEIRTGAHVHSVILEDGRAVGVRYRDADGEHELRADTVVLAAGALESPAILLRSGIGPAEELGALGIDVAVDSPQVGRNLHDHLLSPVIFTTTARAVEPPQPGVSVTQTHAFWRSLPDLPEPDTQPIHFSVPMFSDELPATAEHGFSLMAGIVRPRSRGALRITGPELDDPLEIDLGALQDPEDVRSLAASVRQMRRVGRQAALAEEWGSVELYPGPDVADEDVEDYVRRTAITYHHQVGTCRMGSDAEAVVDARLRVRGVSGLRVIDASVMPTITTGNTNAPAVMIGERGAALLLEDLREAQLQG